MKSVCKFCEQLQLECTKFIKEGIFEEFYTLASYPVHLGIIEDLVTSLCQASKFVYSSWMTRNVY